MNGENVNVTYSVPSAPANSAYPLTAVMHELGHALGLPEVNDEDELMGGVLGPGAGRLPMTDDVDRVHAAGSWLEFCFDAWPAVTAAGGTGPVRGWPATGRSSR